MLQFSSQNLSILDPNDLLRLLRNFRVVRNNDKRLSKLRSAFHQQPHRILTRPRIQISGRLVCKNDAGLCNQRTGDCHTLLPVSYTHLDVYKRQRVWWVQAESVLGFVNEYNKSGDAKYRDAAADIYHYICNVMVDKRPGSEWFWEVDADGKPSSRKPILEPWKCPYHNGRMCMELIRRNPDVTV